MVKPVDRCCCSVCATGGTAHCCCGPPIWMAARGACILLCVYSVLLILQSIIGFTQDDCTRMTSNNVAIAVIIINVIGIIIYAWGIIVAQNKMINQAQFVWIAHAIITTFIILSSICQFGYGKGPRAKDPLVDAACFAKCKAEGRTRGGPFGGDPCEQRRMVGGAWGQGAFVTVISGYLGFVLWSFAQRAKDGTMEDSVVFIAAPMAVSAQPTAFAIPVATSAIPYAQAIPIADPAPVALSSSVEHGHQSSTMYPKMDYVQAVDNKHS